MSDSDIPALVAQLRKLGKHRADFHNIQPHRVSWMNVEELPETLAANLLEQSLTRQITADQVQQFKHAFYDNTGDEADDPFVKAFAAMGWLPR